MGSKGRPPKIIIEDLPRKFTRTFKYIDKSYSEWHYDLDKNPNGPIMVEIFYPEEFFNFNDEKKSKRNGSKKRI